MRSAKVVLLLTTIVGFLPAQAKRPAIGDRVEAFEVIDIRHLRRSLADFGKRKGFVLFFVTNECPIVLRLLPSIRKLAAEFGPKGVEVLALNVGPGDTVREMAACAVEHDMPFPFVKDFEGEAAKACGVDRTATAVVLTADRRLYFRGRVDQRYRFSGVSPRPGREDLREALVELLVGKECSVPETPVEGCAITWPKVYADKTLTYCRDIAPLIQRHCQDCHRPHGAAPFRLLTYDEVARRGEMIAEVVRQRRMPPWYASDKFGKFANHRGLSPDETRMLLGWIGAGMAKGDPRHLPKPRKFARRTWRIDEPDLVLKLPFAIKLPAEGYLPYKYFVFPHKFTEDTWVEQIEILPSNRKVLHHANVARIRGLRYEAGDFITGQVPGGDPMVLDPGSAVLIPKGAVLGIQCHYVTTGKPEVDRLRIGLRFPRVVVKRRLHHLQIGNYRFKIPPHASHHPVQRSKVVPFDAEAIGLFAHMHLRGKDMMFTAITPDGVRQTLLLVPNYNFDWQQSYRFAPEQVFFAKGTRILVEAHFDNSGFNPFNPDPERTVPYGNRTIDEMMFGFVFFFRRNEDLGLRIDPETGHALAD